MMGKVVLELRLCGSLSGDVAVHRRVGLSFGRVSPRFQSSSG